jgi:pimeloyl-ACP methyl ester carboxylesterase
MADALSPTLISACGGEVELRRAGHGPRLLVLHGEFGVPGALEAHRLLAREFEVIIPSLPGYGASTRHDWIMGVHDLAAWVRWLARSLDLGGGLHVLGCSLGGWVAAELAALAPEFFGRLVLAGPMGIKPDRGEIFDYFLEGPRTGLETAVAGAAQCAEFQRFWGGEWSAETADRAEQHREMTCRIAWKPYMHSLTLRPRLGGIAVPTLVVCGAEDRVVPPDAAEIYAAGIPGARLMRMGGCGHMPEIEQPAAFAEAVGGFLRG